MTSIRYHIERIKACVCIWCFVAQIQGRAPSALCAVLLHVPSAFISLSRYFAYVVFVLCERVHQHVHRGEAERGATAIKKGRLDGGNDFSMLQ